MDIVEALADCIMRFEGWQAPNITTYPIGSTSWRNRNPGNLRNSSYLHNEDEKGYAVFTSLATGWQALQEDILDKLTCKSSHKLTAESTLHDLFNIYAPAIDNNDPQHYSRIVAGWLNLIYNTNMITPDTKLGDLIKLK
jgi:hypothetical protein